MSLQGRTIGVLVGPLFEDLEFWSVVMRVREEGAKVVVIGSEKNVTYPSKSGGLSATSDVAARDVDATDLDALLVPGGFAPDKMRRDADMLRLVRELDGAKKVLGFICHAGWVAASAGILRNRNRFATGSTGIKDDLENAGAIWKDEAAFQDGNLVWGRVVDDIPEYQRLLVRALLAGTPSAR